jgi:prophage ps3 protein 01
MYSALEVARFVIEYCRKNDLLMSNLKLQKVLYFIQAEFLVRNGEPCFFERIEAWPFGPVVSNVYHEYKTFGSSNIYSNLSNFYDIAEEDRNIIKDIVKACNRFSATQLVELTHNQAPWKNAYNNGNRIITNDSILEYFGENNNG